MGRVYNKKCRAVKALELHAPNRTTGTWLQFDIPRNFRRVKPSPQKEGAASPLGEARGARGDSGGPFRGNSLGGEHGLETGPWWLLANRGVPQALRHIWPYQLQERDQLAEC